jgi:putative DNA-invertase from lambdoid prophage Rac
VAASIGVGFVSLSEGFDLSTPSGRALAGMLAAFADFERDIVRDRVQADIPQARKDDCPHGRPPTRKVRAPSQNSRSKNGLSKIEISPSFHIGRTSVRRFLGRTKVRSAKRSALNVLL